METAKIKISKGKLKEAIEEQIEYFEKNKKNFPDDYKEIHQKLINLSAQYCSLKNDKLLNCISDEFYYKEQNRITLALTELIKEMEDLNITTTDNESSDLLTLISIHLNT